MIPDGVEPSSPVCRTGVVPLDHGSVEFFIKTATIECGCLVFENHGDEMSGMFASLILPDAFDIECSALMESILKASAKSLKGSRKGRYWEFTIENCLCSLSVFRVAERFGEFEQELAQLGLDPNENLEAVVIECGVKNERVEQGIDEIIQRMLNRFPGARSTPPE